MTTQYTPILKLALPVTGELSGTWGDVVNDNITSMVEQAIAGLATINTWTANAHTLTTANGTTSESRCAMLVADDDGGGNPSAAAEIICPAATKIYILKNISGQQVTLKTSGGSGVAVPNGQTMFLFCNGTDVLPALTYVGALTTNTITSSTGTFGSITASLDSSFTSTGALAISKGTTGQQPGSPTTGMVRYNTTTDQFEGYSGSSPSWKSIGGSAISNDTSTASNLYPIFAGATSGTAENVYTSNAKLLYKPSTGEFQSAEVLANNGLFVNNMTVGTSYTIPSGYSASSVGPVTVSGGVSVTVPSGSRWVVL